MAWLEPKKYLTTVKLSEIANIDIFLQIINKYRNYYTLKSGKYIADAKSLLGIFSLDLTKGLDLYVDIAEEEIVDLLQELEQADLICGKDKNNGKN